MWPGAWYSGGRSFCKAATKAFMKPIIFHAKAEAELLAAARHYEKRRAGLGLDFLDKVEQAAKHVQDHPKLCPPYGRKGYRFFRVKRFPYVLYFREMDYSIRVFAVAHGRRRQG